MHVSNYRTQGEIDRLAYDIYISTNGLPLRKAYCMARLQIRKRNDSRRVLSGDMERLH